MLSVLSGCLGKSRKLRLWLWNLVPKQACMPSNDVPKKLLSILWYVWFAFLRCSGKSCRSLVRERDSGLYLTRAAWNTGLRCWPWIQGPIRIWASWCRILVPHQARNLGPIWVWVPRCHTYGSYLTRTYIFFFGWELELTCCERHVEHIQWKDTFQKVATKKLK